MIVTRVADIAQHVDKDVRLQGWLYNKRSSKKLQFLQVRDGSGIIQAIVSLDDVGADTFALADRLTQESSITWDPLESTCRHASLSIL